MDADHNAADLASWLHGAREQLTASGGLGMRYAAGDVDAFLSGVAADLGRGVLPDPECMRTVRFGVTRLGHGYPEREVDKLIRGLERRLGEAAGTGVPVSSDMEPVIARITDAQFRTTRREGYDEREVDDFLDDVIQALRRGQRAGPPSGFTTVRLRPGYNKQDVDALVSEIWPEWGAG
jgi:DivIVA domain-containing protein